MSLLNLYIVLSFSLFVGISAKIWYTYENVYETCHVLVTDKVFSIFTFNFFLALEAILMSTLIYIIIGNLNTFEKKRLAEKFTLKISDLFFSLFWVIDDLGIRDFFMMTIPLFCHYMSFCFEQKILSFSLSAVPPKLKENQRIITGQILSFFGFLYILLPYIKSFIQRRSNFTLFLIFQMAQGIDDIVLYIYSHINYIIDRKNSGNSQSAYKANLTAQLFAEFFHVLFNLIFLLYILKNGNYPLYMVRSIVECAKAMMSKVSKYQNFSKMCSFLGDLPDTPEKELQEEPTCIICRNVMEFGKSKRLPCGHSFHVECLERWVGQQAKCPTCSRDLTSIIKMEPNPSDQNEDLPDNNINNNDDIVDNFDNDNLNHNGNLRNNNFNNNFNNNNANYNNANNNNANNNNANNNNANNNTANNNNTDNNVNNDHMNINNEEDHIHHRASMNLIGNGENNEINNNVNVDQKADLQQFKEEKQQQLKRLLDQMKMFEDEIIKIKNEIERRQAE